MLFRSVYLASPPEMRSRILGVLSVCIGTGPIGFIWLGWLADRIGAHQATAITGGLGLLARQLAVALHVGGDLRVRQVGVEFSQAHGQALQLQAEGVFHGDQGGVPEGRPARAAAGAEPGPLQPGLGGAGAASARRPVRQIGRAHV